MMREEKDKISQTFSSEDSSFVRSYLVDNQIEYVFVWQDEERFLTPEFKDNLDFLYKNQEIRIYKFKG